jgi:hypothetical protein
VKKKKGLLKQIETIWLAKQVKNEMINFHKGVDECVRDFGYRKEEMLDFPKWPYALKTPDGSYVCTPNPDKRLMLCLFLTADEAEQMKAMFHASTGNDCEVVQPEHNFPFRKDIVLMIKDCGFEMWYGTYRSVYHLQTIKSMEATGLL